MYGSQAYSSEYDMTDPFEKDVNMYGSQAIPDSKGCLLKV